MRAAIRSVRQSDAGFSLTELTVTLVIMAIVVGLTVGMIVGIQQEQVNVNNTVTGSRQSQLASEEVVQYLRAASTPISPSGSPPTGGYPSWFTGSYTETSTSLELPVWVGVQSPTPSTPNVDVMQLTYSGSCNPKCPAGAGELQVTITGQKGSRTVATYYVVAPGANQPIFTYSSYVYVKGATTGTTQVMGMPAGGITENCALVQIVAVQVDMSLFASAGHQLVSAYAADLATTLQTTIYLRNADDTFSSTTTSVPTPPGGCTT